MTTNMQETNFDQSMLSITSLDNAHPVLHEIKPRKKYTMTKKREIWTKEEQDRFVEGLQLYNRDWKRVTDHVRTKTISQTRSHAQKYFLKLKKRQSLEIGDYAVTNTVRYSGSSPSSPRESRASISAFSPVRNSFDYEIISSPRYDDDFDTETISM